MRLEEQIQELATITERLGRPQELDRELFAIVEEEFSGC